MKIRVGVLGATGAVGQRFVQLLSDHPYFEIAEVAASERSAGKHYKEAVAGKWILDFDIPAQIASMTVKECKPGLACKVVFSALDSSVAGPIEEDFAKAGYYVVSNSKNHRFDEDVPMLIPEVNSDHLGIIPVQQKKRGWKGFITVKPNCSLQSYLVALAPLHRKFGVKRAIVTTMQAVSGAGYPGVASLDILDNLVPYIGGEEEKSEKEPLKILGHIEGDRIVDAKGVKFSAHCNRVNIVDGHTATVSVEFERKPTREEIIASWDEFSGEPQELALPSAPKRAIVYRTEENRPQPRLDRMQDGGMGIVVGRLRPCNVFDYRFVCLSHNTIRGAAGGAVLIAELLHRKGMLQ
jgi:aspartate-semialdehyde dehydrogenase